MGFWTTGRAGENHGPRGRSGNNSGPMSGGLERKFTGKPGLMGAGTGPGRGAYRRGTIRPGGAAGRGPVTRDTAWRWGRR